MQCSLLGAVLATGCTVASEPDPCTVAGGEGALATCLQPTQTEAYYIEKSHMYFDTMDTNEDREVVPPYSEWVARWEWPPWLKLTGFGRESMIAADTLLRLYESTIPERDCRAFDVHPFGRCRVTFYYAEHEGQPCPIYEEFTFNDAGEITFIEAWSDQVGMLPMDAEADPWAEGEDAVRLSGRLPGLGNSEGLLDLESDWMEEAAGNDTDVADFVQRAEDWHAAWLAELEASGDDLWAQGCGWPAR